MKRQIYPTSFWQHPDGCKVRVLHLFPISWDNTFLADIKLNDESVTQIVSDMKRTVIRLPNSTLKYTAMQIGIGNLSRQEMTFHTP